MDLKTINQKIGAIQHSHSHGELNTEKMSANPFEQFVEWFSAVLATKLYDPSVMVLATVDAKGAPDARIVLLKELEPNRFIFFTNYLSNKGQQIAHEKRAAIVFYWPDVSRQVRIRGDINKIDRHQSELYFSTRPRSAQLSAYVSRQSMEIADRNILLKNIELMEEKFGNNPISCPEHWGGYALTANEYEFFQGRRWRMHDRILYTLKNSLWTKARLSP
jgi:pyridoxamine 5'-phosphate oxidase